MFLDIQGASFDNIIPQILQEDLREIGVPALIRKFIANVTLERNAHFIVNGELKGPYKIRAGTLQGAILSPLFFNLYLRKIGQCVGQKVHILQYADDLVIFTTSKNVETAAERIQSTLNDISSFLGEKGLTLSPSKSKIMLFNRKRANFTWNNNINIQGDLVPRVTSARFLGIIFDEKLKGKAHLQYLNLKCRKLVDIISTLTGVKWGSHPSLLLNLYKAAIRSVIDYGCQTYCFKGNTMFDNRNLNQLFLKLARLQYRAIRTALGLRKSTPINVLLSEARELIMRDRTLFLTSKFIFRSLSRSNSLTIRYLTQLTYSMKSQIHKVKIMKDFQRLNHLY